MELYPWNYSNIGADTLLQGDSGWESCSVGECSFVELTALKGAAAMVVFLNSQANSNPFRVYEKLKIPNVDGQLKFIHVYFEGFGIMDIKEFVGVAGLPIRV
jgi:hypothetical protein